MIYCLVPNLEPFSGTSERLRPHFSEFIELELVELGQDHFGALIEGMPRGDILNIETTK